MIPSPSRVRLFGLIALVIAVCTAILWVVGQIPVSRSLKPWVDIFTSMVVLFLLYLFSPAAARFLAPHSCNDPAKNLRLSRVLDELANPPRVVLYEHKSTEANTVGLLESQVTIFMTTGLLNRLDDGALRGVIAHEMVHIKERHILATLVYACAFVVTTHITGNNIVFFAAFFLFLGMRRYFEFRADAGAAQRVGVDAMVKALEQVGALFPRPPKWIQYASFFSPYPTILQRQVALQTGRFELI